MALKKCLKQTDKLSKYKQTKKWVNVLETSRFLLAFFGWIFEHSNYKNGNQVLDNWIKKNETFLSKFSIIVKGTIILMLRYF